MSASPLNDLSARPRPRVRLRLLSIAALLLLLPPLLISLDERTDMHTMERLTLLSAQETWLRIHDGERHAWLIPTLAEKPRLRKPPLVVWTLMLAWVDLDPDTVSPQQLIFRARLVSVGFTLLLLASVGWIGLSLGDRRLALISVLAVGSMWFLQRQGRSASYDIHVAAWATLSVAAGLWAMRPTAGPSPSIPRQITGWLISSLALAGCWMSKNPLALLFVMPPLLTAAVMRPAYRWRTLGWLAASTALGILLTRPWYWQIDRIVPGAAEIRALEYRTVRKEYQGPHYYVVALLGLVAPWTIWFIAGLFQPFLRALRARRRMELIAWLWFAIAFVAMSAHPAKQQRYILPLVAPIALLAGQVLRDHEDDLPPHRDGEGLPLASLHWISLTIASLALGVFWSMQDLLVHREVLDEAAFAAIGLPLIVLLGVVLLAICLGGWREHRHGRVINAAVATSIWASVLTTAVWWGYSNAPNAAHPALAESLRLREAVRGQPVYELRMEANDERPLDQWMRLFMVRRAKTIEASELAEVLSSVQRPCIVTWDKEKPRRLMESSGFAAVMRVEAGRGAPLVVWREALE